MHDYTTIQITLKDGTVDVWESDKWGGFFYEDKYIVIEKEHACVGLYNMDVVSKLVLK